MEKLATNLFEIVFLYLNQSWLVCTSNLHRLKVYSYFLYSCRSNKRRESNSSEQGKLTQQSAFGCSGTCTGTGGHEFPNIMTNNHNKFIK